MKKMTVLTVACLISAIGLCQNYQLFRASTRKVFTTYPAETCSYSLQFDSVIASGPDSIYYNFFAFRDTTVIADSCLFWGPPNCFKQDAPVWPGQKIVHDNSGHYRFFNAGSDTLFFNFTINIGDTALFYGDALQRFSMVYGKKDTVTVCGSLDSARFYRVIHTDAGGNIINSDLHNKEIIVAKDLGLCRFFRIDSFPSVLKPLRLIGSTSPNLGLFHITAEMLYDYHAGDLIQYYESYDEFGWNPPWEYRRYRTHVFLSRTDLPDSIIYSVEQEVFEVGATQSVIDTITVCYLRNQVIAQIPYERYASGSCSLCMVEYCGIPLWTYVYQPDQTLMYCQEENCWGFADTQGPPLISATTYAVGLGIYHYSGYKSPAPPVTNGFSEGNDIVFFLKNGIPCGSQVIVGMSPIAATDPKITVHPNPANGIVTINAAVPLHVIDLFDLGGRVVFSGPVEGTSATIDLSSMDEGIYFAKFQFADKQTAVKKIVLIR